MVLSTRELLNQIDECASDRATIEKYYGEISNAGDLFQDPQFGPALKELGVEALSTKALKVLAAGLQMKNW
jgi:hypothetical protein